MEEEFAKSYETHFSDCTRTRMISIVLFLSPDTLTCSAKHGIAALMLSLLSARLSVWL